MFSITQVLPEDLAMTSVTTLGSTPKPSAMRNASLTATAATPAMRLLQSLATSPLPTGPTWITLAPIASSAGLAAWKSSAEAPTMGGGGPRRPRGVPPGPGAPQRPPPPPAAAGPPGGGGGGWLGDL